MYVRVSEINAYLHTHTHTHVDPPHVFLRYGCTAVSGLERVSLIRQQLDLNRKITALWMVAVGKVKEDCPFEDAVAAAGRHITQLNHRGVLQDELEDDDQQDGEGDDEEKKTSSKGAKNKISPTRARDKSRAGIVRHYVDTHAEELRINAIVPVEPGVRVSSVKAASIRMFTSKCHPMLIELVANVADDGNGEDGKGGEDEEEEGMKGGDGDANRDLALALNQVGDETDANNDEDDGETKAVTLTSEDAETKAGVKDATGGATGGGGPECQKVAEFAVEDQVEVVGTSRADLNGVTGTITSALNVENGRIHVRLNDGSTYGTDVALKPEKLKHVGSKGDERRASRSLFKHTNSESKKAATSQAAVAVVKASEKAGKNADDDGGTNQKPKPQPQKTRSKDVNTQAQTPSLKQQEGEQPGPQKMVRISSEESGKRDEIDGQDSRTHKANKLGRASRSASYRGSVGKEARVVPRIGYMKEKSAKQYLVQVRSRFRVSNTLVWCVS
jgi:hypothetical protein